MLAAAATTKPTSPMSTFSLTSLATRKTATAWGLPSTMPPVSDLAFGPVNESSSPSPTGSEVQAGAQHAMPTARATTGDWATLGPVDPLPHNTLDGEPATTATRGDDSFSQAAVDACLSV